MLVVLASWMVYTLVKNLAIVGWGTTTFLFNSDKILRLSSWSVRSIEQIFGFLAWAVASATNGMLVSDFALPSADSIFGAGDVLQSIRPYLRLSSMCPSTHIGMMNSSTA